jgi:hypothetical protein
MSKTLKVSVAEVNAEILCEDNKIINRTQKLFRSYETDQPVDFQIVIQGTSDDFNRKRLLRRHHVELDIQDAHIDIVKRKQKGAPYHLGTINSETNVCLFNLKDINDFSTLFIAVRVCFQYYLEKNNGFFLHAAAGKISNQTYIFTGKSGAGKSTALTNLSPEEIVSEDAVAVRLYNGEPVLFATPFRNERHTSGKAKAVFFPKKGKGTPCVAPESLGQSIAEVISNGLFASPGSPQLMDTAITNVINFCTLVPCFKLYFPKHGSLQELII